MADPVPKSALYDKPVERQKWDAKQAGYVRRGPEPFVCRNCIHRSGRMCELVKGPYRGGEIKDGDTCILFQSKTNTIEKRVQDPRRPAHGRRFDHTEIDYAKRHDELIDPSRAPRPEKGEGGRDFYGDDGTVVRIVPGVNHLIELVVTLPKHTFNEIRQYLEDHGYEIEYDGDADAEKEIEFDDKLRRIVRRGKYNSATNIFLDSD